MGAARNQSAHPKVKAFMRKPIIATTVTNPTRHIIPRRSIANPAIDAAPQNSRSASKLERSQEKRRGCDTSVTSHGALQAIYSRLWKALKLSSLRQSARVWLGNILRSIFPRQSARGRIGDLSSPRLGIYINSRYNIICNNPIVSRPTEFKETGASIYGDAPVYEQETTFFA